MSYVSYKSTALYEAVLLLKELEIDNLPICPFSISDKLGIKVEALPSDQRGCSGMLLRSGNQFGILYATYLENEGLQRFSVSHEVGHYRIPGHYENINMNGLHKSHAGFVSTDRYEIEADHFAANLLMPAFLFNPAMDKAGNGLDAIKELAILCKTSLTATSIRYTEYTPDATAVILSTANNIDFCFMSESLKEFKGLEWIRKGTPVPEHTLTNVFNKNVMNISHGIEKDGTANLQEWFGGDHNVEMLEEIKGLGDYGKTLTVLSTSDLPTEEELEEEENLMDSWTPRFRR